MSAIYALCHPVTLEVRYIGKANDPASRLKGHLRDSAHRNTPVYCWINKLKTEGLTPIMMVLEVVSGDWREAEIRLIALHRDSGRLLNVADGGDEPYCPIKVRAANGAKTAKAIHSNPKKKRLWFLKRAIGQLITWFESVGNHAKAQEMREILNYAHGIKL